MGNLRPKSEVDESEPDEEITNATTKVGTQTIFYVQPGLQLRGFSFLEKISMGQSWNSGGAVPLSTEGWSSFTCS